MPINLKNKIFLLVAVAAILIVGFFLIFRSSKNNKDAVMCSADAKLCPDGSSVGRVGPACEFAACPAPIESIEQKTPTSPKPNLPVSIPLPLGTDQFVVSLTATSENISTNLLEKDYIKNSAEFISSIREKSIAPGAYKISKEMTPAQILQTLRGKPYMKWVLIAPGLRKEEIAELLAPALGWTAKQKTEWITKSTTTKPEYLEGVYMPDTYLLPVGERPAEVAARLIAKFNENFAPYLPKFTAKNIKWTGALTLASIVQREASNVADMPLIAGILWNRLNANMMLGVDATLQYIRGNKGAGWWAPITLADKKIDSPYNTYMHKGLPPHPIANPSVNAIDAVLNPLTTDCLYYLHDKNRVTHCAVTYEEHQKNIETYL